MDSAVFDTDLIALLFAARPGACGRAAADSVADPARLGRRMAALYAVWQRRRPPPMRALCACLLRRTGVSSLDPLGRCCLAAAEAVEAWGGLPYHSATHHAEVATNAMVLVELAERLGQPVDGRAAALLLAVCLAHDLHYRPPAGRARFAAERISADALDTIAADAGCSAQERGAMRALVIATEPGLRLRPGGPLAAPLDPAARALLASDGAAPDASPPDASPPDASPPDASPPDGTFPDIHGLAGILSDADLLSSVGLTVAWYEVQKSRLEREWGQKQRRADSLRFFRDIVGPGFLSAPGRVFAPNLAVIQASACA
ncbi:MAG: hypothetical protein JSR21_06730 [Proteobacteria bacterium]|nr:hypothetical protein [Pseudomonadota bacterium]